MVSPSLHALLASCLLAVLLGAASTAAAQSGASSNDAAARIAFEEGAAAYELGRFEQALAAYERAHTLSPRPKLLFNIGRAAEGDAQYDRALAAYEGYLAALPDAENRHFVESRIAKMRTLVATAPGKPSPATEPPPPTVAPLPAALLPSESAPSPLVSAPAAAAGRPSDAPTTERPARSRKRAWWWGVAGTVLVGAAVGTAIALGRKGDGSADTGEVIMTLRQR